MGLLPKEKTKITNLNPKNLIIFGLPKVGKTTALAQLPNSLLIDMEGGADFVSTFTIKAKNYVDLFNIAKALKTEEHSFKFIILDTITALEDMALDLAGKRYQESPMGSTWEGDSVLKLPNGAGYYWQRLAVTEIISWFEKVAENIVLVGHVKDKMLTEGGTELSIKALDLTGKLGNILSAKSDAICYLYRDTETGELMANFGNMNAVLCGARMPHLSGKTIKLAEKLESGEIITHWEDIYPSLMPSKK